MDLPYEHRLINVENDVQDKNSVAWKKLCEYVDKVADEDSDVFSPFEYLGKELYFQIHTLPKSIAKLKKVKKIWLYGSKLKRIPPEIGEMQSLRYFDPYTSYNLHWFPYEIMNCKKLKDSRVSIRALYGNHHYRRPFPDLTNNPVRYEGEFVKCSICKKEMTYEQTNQVWISLWVGTDVLPLLTNLCSKECEDKLPKPHKGYIQNSHKGGINLEQPTEEWKPPVVIKLTKEGIEKPDQSIQKGNLKPIKLVRKIWDEE